MFRTLSDQVSLWEAVLPPELLKLPAELARIDALLDDPVFFTPFVPFFDLRIGRPSTPMETYLRLMFLKFRYRLGYESLCREVSDSITWRRFCRIPLDGAVPHPTTLMKLSTRCGSAAVDGLNEALLAKAVEAKVLRTNRVRADTTVVPANVSYPTDSGLLAKAIRRIGAAGARIHDAGGAVRTRLRDRSRAAGKRAHAIAAIAAAEPVRWASLFARLSPSRCGASPWSPSRRRPSSSSRTAGGIGLLDPGSQPPVVTSAARESLRAQPGDGDRIAIRVRHRRRKLKVGRAGRRRGHSPPRRPGGRSATQRS